MNSSIVIFVVLSVIAAVYSDPHCHCDVPTKFLEEIKCKPVYKNPGDCCPIKFDCNEFESRPKEKCHLMGTFYDLRQSVSNDITYPYCFVGCNCNKGGSGIYPNSDFNCAILDCPEWLGSPIRPGCRRKYEADKCCSVGEICPPFDNLHKCQVDGKTFLEGERFEPSTDPTVKCVCQRGFEGKFTEPFCIKTKCISEITNSKAIGKYCAPVYFKTSKTNTPTCPYQFLCDVPEDKLVRSGKSTEEKCKLSTLRLDIGDKYEKSEVISEFETHNTKCECKIPPFVTCVKSIDYDLEKAPEHIRKHLPQD